MKLNLYRGIKGVLFGSAFVLASSGIVDCSSNNSEEEKFNSLLDTDGCVSHYIDVLSNNCYHEKASEDDVCRFDEFGVLSIDIEQQKTISVYLTKKDLLKSKFTNGDIVEIIQRVREGSPTDLILIQKLLYNILNKMIAVLLKVCYI